MAITMGKMQADFMTIWMMICLRMQGRTRSPLAMR